MKLSDWMEKKKLGDEEAGELFGYSRSHISKLRRSKVSPSFPIVVRIWVRSKFKVGLKDWVDEAAIAENA